MFGADALVDRILRFCNRCFVRKTFLKDSYGNELWSQQTDSLFASGHYRLAVDTLRAFGPTVVFSCPFLLRDYVCSGLVRVLLIDNKV